MILGALARTDLLLRQLFCSGGSVGAVWNCTP